MDPGALADDAAQFPADRCSLSCAPAGAPQDRVPPRDRPRRRALRHRPRVRPTSACGRERARGHGARLRQRRVRRAGRVPAKRRLARAHPHGADDRARAAAPPPRASDLIVNGIDGRDDPRAIVTNDDLGSVIRPGTVIVDLVGGSASNRGAVEPIVECTTPDDPVLRRRRRLPLVGLGLAACRLREGVDGALQRADHCACCCSKSASWTAWTTRPDGIRRALVAGPLAARERQQLRQERRVAHPSDDGIDLKATKLARRRARPQDHSPL